MQAGERTNSGKDVGSLLLQCEISSVYRDQRLKQLSPRLLVEDTKVRALAGC